MNETRYFRKGLGNKENVVDILQADYDSGVVEALKHNGHRLRLGNTELRLAREFGFCYGVDRAVEYAYETRDRFPDRKIWITGEIIHNPGVNRRLQTMGIEFLPPAGAARDRLNAVGAEDVVLIPAFGVEHDDFLRLTERGSILVDTTCGSVLTVWKSVEKYARNGITSVVHGKVEHEETRATCSQVRKYPEAHYLVVRDKEQTRTVCRFLEGDLSAARLLEELPGAASAGFDPERHLERIGLANQTTMLSTESLEIAQMLRVSMAKRHGEAAMPERFHSFDTICSATQDRQDAVNELIEEGCDLMLVIGGFNSSNTTLLVEIASRSTRTYHIEDADNLISAQWIRHQPLDETGAVMEEGWLPSGPLVICLTAGASTPNSEIGRSITRLLGFRGASEAELRELAAEGNRISASLRRSKPAEP
jgi:4-hydroxy-3-methylbut-2-en-1-yl diphosphate reductase